jgi:hypothetical protein
VIETAGQGNSFKIVDTGNWASKWLGEMIDKKSGDGKCDL